MNELTHFLTGYLIARVLLKKKNDHFLSFFLAMAALIPDFDSFVHIFLPFDIFDHAIISHTIIGGILFTLIYTSLIWMIGRKFIEKLDISFLYLFGLALIGLASHLVLDIFTYRQDIATTAAHLYFWPLSNFSWHLNGFFPDIAYSTRILIEVIYTGLLVIIIIFYGWGYKKENPLLMLSPNKWLNYLPDSATMEEAKKPAFAILFFNILLISLMALSLFI